LTVRTLCALLAGAAAGCAPRPNGALEFTIEQALATSPEGADFAEAVAGDWARVCVFRPRTPFAVVDSVLGTAWADTRDTQIETRDDITLLVFARDGRVSGHVLYPVAKGDFGTPGPEQWYCRPRENAVFQLRQPIDGSIPWIGPVERR
jgi:hypothetical protein